jgi:flagellin-like protein
MWSEKARSFRKKNKRGVSPIIATILLVAITVVLAAVLYILISGFTKGPGNTPIGTAFAFATPQKTTGTAGSNAWCATGDECYNILVGSAGGGITAAGINFVIRDSSGNTVPALSATAKVTLISATPAVIATYTVTTGLWAGTPTTGLTTTQTLVLDLGCTPAACSPNPTGLVLVALGVGSYSGSTSTTLT